MAHSKRLPRKDAVVSYPVMASVCALVGVTVGVTYTVDHFPPRRGLRPRGRAEERTAGGSISPALERFQSAAVACSRWAGRRYQSVRVATSTQNDARSRKNATAKTPSSGTFSVA